MVQKIIIEIAVIAIILAAFILFFTYIDSDVDSATSAIMADIPGSDLVYKPEIVKFSIEDKLLTMTELESKLVYINEKYHNITLINVVDRKAQIIIDGKITDKLGVTEEDIINGLKVKIGSISS
ncbi:hypothetical protein KY336_00570 [Candidatus Woesearchaeota archaeon]|nr:hypothetical protein [Candidatus Woesearchaeota archaeon]